MFDRIVTSTNEDEVYLDFWKIQIKSHKIFFPSSKLTMAFLTNREYDDKLIKEMIKEGIDVKIYKPIFGIPEPNLSKILRYYCASEFDDDISTITDMDTIPLQSEYLNSIYSQVERDKILAIGLEVLINTVDKGKFPAHHTSGTGHMFKKMYNPKNLNYLEFVNSLVGINVFHNRENIKNSPVDFSDESLNRALIKLNNVPVKHIERKINIKIDWLDRSWWNMDINKLNSGKYIEANLLRPYKNYINQIKPIEDYLDKLINDEKNH